VRRFICSTSPGEQLLEAERLRAVSEAPASCRATHLLAKRPREHAVHASVDSRITGRRGPSSAREQRGGRSSPLHSCRAPRGASSSPGIEKLERADHPVAGRSGRWPRPPTGAVGEDACTSRRSAASRAQRSSAHGPPRGAGCLRFSSPAPLAIQAGAPTTIGLRPEDSRFTVESYRVAVQGRDSSVSTARRAPLCPLASYSGRIQR